MTVAIDAMGGDHSPQAIVEAVALLPEGERDVMLVGQADAIRACGGDQLNVPIVDAPQVVEMGESPSTAVKQKRESSIALAFQQVRERKATAVISAGNTGAVMAFGMFILGRLPKVTRPGIAIVVPSRTGRCLLLDAGANVDCLPEHLRDFAVMGSAHAATAFHAERPRVGLVSIGSEASKGNELTRKTHAHLEALDFIDYVGNVEGSDVMQGGCDVAVCDGFVGNNVLKFGEALSELLGGILLKELAEAGMDQQQAQGVLGRALKKTDYNEYGGAPLLGLCGGCIICHGRSSARAMRNALQVATETDFEKINERITENLARIHSA